MGTRKFQFTGLNVQSGTYRFELGYVILNSECLNLQVGFFKLQMVYLGSLEPKVEIILRIVCNLINIILYKFYNMQVLLQVISWLASIIYLTYILILTC